jgi:DNA-binding response OmpR family regulator
MANPAKVMTMKDSEVKKVEVSVSAPIRDEPVPAARILVVDDDNDMRRVCVEILIDSGYEALGAVDGAAGWEELQLNYYDLVVTDNKMPRMNGIEMLEKMRSARMALPVIMATSSIPTQVISRKPWLQPDATLLRPFSNENLLEVVKKVLRQDGNYNAHIKMLLPTHL